MIQLTKVNHVIIIIAETYRLTFAHDRPFVYLEGPDKKRTAELFLFSSVHPLHGRDDSTQIRAVEAQERDGEVVLSITTNSSVWDRKTYTFHCRPQRFTYEIEIEGNGQICEANYFGGYYSGQVRWGSGFFWSGQQFGQAFSPEPNTDEINYFSPSEGTSIDLMGVPLPGRANWFFTPPPFFYGFETRTGWLGLGIEAQPGENLFTEYGYHGRKGGFYLSLSYEGHAQVDGNYRLPVVGFDFAGGEWEALEAHVRALQEGGCVPSPRPAGSPTWWQEPIYCGWGSQSYLAEKEKGKAPDYARQRLYEGFLSALDEHDVNPGIVVLDDKWQSTYGENQVDEQKWPDLRGFVDEQHRKGRKVLLWLKAWDPEGVPVEECVRNANGMPLAVDPTHPGFESRLRASVRNMLSHTGYDADGFKIDFTARVPSGPGLRSYGQAWGLEMMRLYLSILYEEAKHTKPDALVMAHTPHPYLSDVVDMIRLNDMNTSKNIMRAMKLRAHVARIACPAAIIDTDNWPVKNLASWRRYLKLQPELGVPSLYFATHIDATKEPLEDEDYQLIREVWARHRANLKKSGKSRKPSARSKGSHPPRWVNDLRRRYAYELVKK